MNQALHARVGQRRNPVGHNGCHLHTDIQHPAPTPAIGKVASVRGRRHDDQQAPRGSCPEQPQTPPHSKRFALTSSSVWPQGTEAADPPSRQRPRDEQQDAEAQAAQRDLGQERHRLPTHLHDLRAHQQSHEQQATARPYYQPTARAGRASHTRRPSAQGSQAPRDSAPNSPARPQSRPPSIAYHAEDPEGRLLLQTRRTGGRQDLARAQRAVPHQEPDDRMHSTQGTPTATAA